MPIAGRRRGSKIKGIQFTLMVVGTSGTGRTTFVNTLCEQEVLSHKPIGDPNYANVEDTVAIKPVTVELEEDGVRISLTVVDTPGFGNGIDNEHAFQDIVEYLERQFDDILAEQSRIKRNPRFKDNRVHAVLYFIPPTGHSLKEMDIELMKRLAPRANVIPLIGRSDSLSPRELKAFKKRIMEDIEYYDIPIYNFPYDIEEDDDETVQENMELRALLPLAVVGSEEIVEVDGESIRARVYPWGLVEVDNPEHSDFVRLRSALFGSHLNDLKALTEDVLYETYRTEKLSKTVTDARQSQVLPEDLANQSVRLKEDQLRREEERLREIELKVQREINERRQQLAAKEETLRYIFGSYEHMHPAEGLDDDELEQIRRYEDFTTIGTIHKLYFAHKDLISGCNAQTGSRTLSSSGIGASARHTRTPRTLIRVWVPAHHGHGRGSGRNTLTKAIAGVVIGVNAAILSIVTAWLSDIKFGYCSDGWWLNEQFCCWEIEGEDVNGCDSWHTWSNVMLGRWLVFVLFATLFSFVAAHLVRSLAKYAAGSGISEIKCILAGFTMQGFLGFATVVIKSITLPLVIASGLSVGKEGPSVHVACCIGFLVAGLFKKFSRSQGKMREIITAASAAGVAVAFGSPIGGVLFSIEEMSHGFSIKTMWKSFFCALVATVTLSAMNPFRTGKLVLFQITYDRDWHFFEIMFYVILGIFGGLYGAFVVKFNIQVAAFRRKHLANHGVSEAVILATLTAMIGYFNRFLRMDMTASMALLFRECEAGGNAGDLCQSSAQWRLANSLLLATVIRMGLVVISYGCKVPAGIFVPSMAIGATFGRMIGIIVKAMEKAYNGRGIFSVCKPDVPCITPGTYAFLGAAAALSGIMRITVTVVVIMFELTGALNYILPTMIVLLVTKAVGDFLGTTGIADEMIRFNGFPFLEKEDHAYNVSVSAVMRTEVHTLVESGMKALTCSTLEDALEANELKGFPIVSADGLRHIIGYIGRTELRYVLDRAKRMPRVDDDTLCQFSPPDSDHDGHNATFGVEEEAAGTSFFESALSHGGLRFWPWVNQTPITVSPELPLEIVMQLFKRMGYVEQFCALRNVIDRSKSDFGGESGSVDRASDG
ncbi:hypothetical protein H0H92_013758 [Tricholoma furcatifolium]|nr:hypothetical protein H0H92_013758 [Tricholoma furcatifolium]